MSCSAALGKVRLSIAVCSESSGFCPNGKSPAGAGSRCGAAYFVSSGDVHPGLASNYRAATRHKRKTAGVRFHTLVRKTPAPFPASLPPLLMDKHHTATVIAAISMLAAFFFGSPRSNAQALFTFESGPDGWVPSGFNTTGTSVTVGTSPVGATEGSSSSLMIRQTSDGFSWNAKRESFAGNPDAFYNAMNATSVNESLWTLQFDVTYRDADIPDASPPKDYLSLSLWINSDDGFRTIFGPTGTTTRENKVDHVVIPFTSFSGGLATDSSFYQMGIGMDGGWGTGSATIYVDNIRVVPEPSPFVQGIIAVSFSLMLHRRRRVQAQ